MKVTTKCLVMRWSKMQYYEVGHYKKLMMVNKAKFWIIPPKLFPGLGRLLLWTKTVCFGLLGLVCSPVCLFIDLLAFLVAKLNDLFPQML